MKLIFLLLQLFVASANTAMDWFNHKKDLFDAQKAEMKANSKMRKTSKSFDIVIDALNAIHESINNHQNMKYWEGVVRGAEVQEIKSAIEKAKKEALASHETEVQQAREKYEALQN